MSKECRKPRSKSDIHWDLEGPCDKDIQANSPSGQSLTIPESALGLLGSPSWNLLVDRVHDKAQPPGKGHGGNAEDSGLPATVSLGWAPVLQGNWDSERVISPAG